MIRILDLFFALLAALIFSWLIFLIAVIVRLTSPGAILYWSSRVGKGNVLFMMPKFRTMRVDTPAVATHLLVNPVSYLTPVGSFLRRSSLDELPQLWCILNGQMSLVGPRPALFNQTDLISLRTKFGIELLPPGLTGWAQINGRDDMPISEKVRYDYEYAQRRSAMFNLKILCITFLKVLQQDGVSH